MYIYALLKTPSSPISLPPGIFGALQLVGNAAISAIVEPELASEDLEQDNDRLLQAVMSHDRVIHAVFLQTTVLPSRFGCFVAANHLVDDLKVRQQQYLDRLNQLEGKAEYLLQFTPCPFTEPPIPPDAKGKDYFLAKKRQYQAQVEQQQTQQQELKQLVTAIAQRYHPFKIGEAQAGTEKLYLLVDRQHEGELQEQIIQWQQPLHTWQLSLSEALPPYHFLEP